VAALSVIDLLEGLLDGELDGKRVLRFSNDELEEFVFEVERFYDAQDEALAVSAEPIIRCYPGAFQLDADGSGYFPPANEYLLSSLLYVDQVVIDCRLAWTCKLEAIYRRGRHRYPNMPVEGPNDESLKELFAVVVDSYREISALIRAGYIVPMRAGNESADEWKGRDNPFFRRCDFRRELEKVRSLQGMSKTLGRLDEQIIGDIAIDVAYGIERSTAHAARFLPTNQLQAAYYFDVFKAIGAISAGTATELKVVTGVVGTGLPLFTTLNQDDILSIRSNEESFEAWRAGLREAIRTIEVSPSDPDEFAVLAKESLLDRITIASGEVDKAVDRSQVLRESVRERSIDAGISALAAVGGAGILGAPVAPTALGGIAVGAGLRLLYENLFKNRTQSQSVAMYLARRET
jgi:hypothetical protein